jgi:hypothetical protein
MAICALTCLPAAVSLLLLEALFMQISGVSLALSWPPQALFTQSSPVCDATATSFPLSEHTGGGDTAPAFSGLCVYLQFMWEVGLPPLLWSFLPFSTLTSFSAPGCWACAPTPALSGQAWLVYLQFCEGFPSPPLRCSGCPTLFATCLYCSIAYYSVSFFPRWGLVCSGGYADLAQGCLWKYHVPLSSLCGPYLPKLSGH